MKDLSNEELKQGINKILESDSFNNELARDILKSGMTELLRRLAAGEEAVKIAELEKELFDIKSKTFCAYCGFEIAIDNDAPLKIEAHIFECKKHPVCILSKRIAELEKEVERLKATALAKHKEAL